ncbi:MAG: LytR/AlgR family response regulator transcription factor, partial [Gammaproteobacteria bacterium]
IDTERLQAAVDRASTLQEQNAATQDKRKLLDLIIGITGKSEKSVSRLLRDHTAGSSYPDRIAIKDGGRTTLVMSADIDWVDAAGDYMCIHAEGQTHIMRGTMKKLEEVLNPRRFQRVHRSTIVNIDRVREIRSHINGEYFLILEDDVELKMSRHYKDRIKHFVPEV